MLSALILPALSLLLGAGPATAGRFVLTDGSVIVGTEGPGPDAEHVVLTLGVGSRVTVRRSEIARRENGSEPPPTPAAARTSGDPVVDAAVAAFLPAPPVLRFHGSNSMGERLIPALVERFLATRGASSAPWLAGAQPQARTLLVPGQDQRLPQEIEVRAFGSETAAAALATGAADLAMVARPLRPEEIASLKPLGDFASPAAATLIGAEAIAVIVHPGNPLKALRLEQLAAIFSGEVNDWSALGGSLGPIGLRLPDERSGLPETFQAQALGGRRLSANAERIGSSQALAARVAEEPGAIGIVGQAYIDRAKALELLVCHTSVAPTSFALKVEDYPLVRRLYLYARPQERPAVLQDFLAFVASPAGQGAVAAAGFANLEVERDGGATRRARRQGLLEDDSVDLGLARTFLKATEGAERLSATIRFAEGRSEPDSDAAAVAARVAAYLNQAGGPGGGDHRQLLVLGYAGSGDKHGGGLSGQRANAVATLLGRAGITPALKLGLGDAVAPCAEVPGSRVRSRQVELWLR